MSLPAYAESGSGVAGQSSLPRSSSSSSAAPGQISSGHHSVNNLIHASDELSAPAIADKDGKIFIYAAGDNNVAANLAPHKDKKHDSNTVIVNEFPRYKLPAAQMCSLPDGSSAVLPYRKPGLLLRSTQLSLRSKDLRLYQ